jgi:hypothetical protein
MAEIQSWNETPAGAFRAAMGMPMPTEQEWAFAAELDQRETALHAFDTAWRPDGARPPRTAYEHQQALAAARPRPGSDWIPVTAADTAEIIQRMTAQRLADQVARDAQVYGPPDDNPATAAALEKMRAASARTNADWARGEPLPPDHVGRTIQ